MRKYALIICLVLIGCAAEDNHRPPKRPDFSKPKSVRDAEKDGCGCAPVKTAVATVDSVATIQTHQVAGVRS